MLAAERYDGAEPVNLGTGEEISIRELAETIADADRLRGRDRLGHVDAERPAAPQPRHERGPQSCFGFRGADAAREGLERTVAWYRELGRLVPPSLRLEQRHPLREDRVLVGELRDHRRVVQQHDDDEQERRSRTGPPAGSRVDADPAGDRVQAAAPDREDEQHEAGQRARAARSAPAAGGSGSARRSRASSSERRDRARRSRRASGVMPCPPRGTTLPAEQADEERQQHLGDVVDRAERRDRRGARARARAS